MTDQHHSRFREFLPFLVVAALLALFLFSIDALADAAATVVPVAESAAPPQWAQDLILTVETMPVVGPYVVKALVYVGILSALLTTIVACLLSVIATLTGAFNLSGLTSAADFLQRFRDGQFMYWLKYFSLFNAKKPQ